MKRFKATVGLMLAVATLILVSSCSKNDEKVLADFTIQMSGAEYPLSMKTMSNNTIQFTSGHVIISEIVFDGDREGEDDVSISHEQISQIDLATGTATPPVTIEIPAGKYNEVYLGIEILDDDDIHPLSVLAEGTFTDSLGKTTPIRFEFNSGEVFEAETDQPVVVDPGTNPLIKVEFNPGDWFSVITVGQLMNADKNGSGVVVISEEMNEDIFDLVADELDERTETIFN